MRPVLDRPVDRIGDLVARAASGTQDFSDERFLHARGNADARPTDVPSEDGAGSMGPMTMFVVGASRGEILLNERHASERGMVGIDTGIENRDNDSITRKR